MNDPVKDRMIRLTQYGVPRVGLTLLSAGSMYFEKIGGIPLTDYWNTSEFDNRDEFFLIANTYFSLSHLVTIVKPKNDWRLAFDVAFLFQAKANEQSILSIDRLTRARCYSDAFTLCRSLHSRLNFLLLCSLNPSLFDQWLRKPNEMRFVDGKIRKELKKHGLRLMEHLYKMYSEIVHGQYQALADSGYMETGIFPEILPISNQLYVTAKFLLSMSCYAMLSMAIVDLGTSPIPQEIQDHETLFDFLKKNVLVPNRFDHLWTIMAEERHWEKLQDGEYRIGDTFNYDVYRNLLYKFHGNDNLKISQEYQTT